MHKNLVIFVYFIVSLLIIAIFAKTMAIFVDNHNSPKPAPTAKAELYKDSNGNLKYAVGSCNTDTDCVPTGCSEEICGSEPVLSTCVVKEDTANTSIYRCGCFENKCAWGKK